MAVTGIDTVLRNLRSQISQIEGATQEGLLAAGLFVQGESQEKTPVEFGVLNNSAFTQITGPLRVSVGYTAEYAAFVHEMPATNNFTKPGTGPKFLEKAVKNNVPEILKIIQVRAKIK